MSVGCEILDHSRHAAAGQHGEALDGHDYAAAHDVVPAQNRQAAVEVLHQRGEAFDPVAVVAIQHAADVADLGLVDVAAHDAVEAARAGFTRQRLLEGTDVADGILHPVL